MTEFDVERLPLRLGLAASAAVGALVLVARSFLYDAAPAIPYGIFPDLRPVLVLGIVGGLGVAGAFFQGARAALLWTIVLLALVFELDHATVHWFSSFEGTLVGGRLDPVRLGGGVVALASALLLHADAHAASVVRDATARGVPQEEAEAARDALVALGRRRTALLGASTLGAGAVVVAADVALGESTVGPGGAGLAAGLAVIALLVAVLLGPVRARSG